MLQPLRLLRWLTVCATMSIAQQAFAAVVILEGKSSPVSSAPEKINPQAPATPDETVLSAQPPPLDGQTFKPSITPAVTASPTVGTTLNPQSAISSNPKLVASDLATAKVANPADLTVQMIPGQTVSVGSHLSFRITSKKPGYLVLVDVGANGHLTQIYPNTASLIRTNNPKGNYIKPSGALTIPLASDPYTGGVEYVVSPPNGRAMIVAILSPQPVQMLDLPDVPPEFTDQAQRLAWLAKWTSELRIPDKATNQLREVRWSFNAKPYIIQ